MLQQLKDALLGRSRVYQDRTFGRFATLRFGGLLGRPREEMIAWESDRPVGLGTVPQDTVPVRIYAPVSGPDRAHISVLAATVENCIGLRDAVKDLMFEDYCLMHDFDPESYDPQARDLPTDMVFLTADDLVSEVRFIRLEIGNDGWIRQRIMTDGDACLWADTGLDHMAWQIFFKEGQIVDCRNTVA